uniref:Uncharacterized protein n=1 Tax=Rhizophora mucronata TaxID=61149 RepID=A0A2P2P7C4_RHIMU
MLAGNAEIVRAAYCTWSKMVHHFVEPLSSTYLCQ